MASLIAFIVLTMLGLLEAAPLTLTLPLPVVLPFLLPDGRDAREVVVIGDVLNPTPQGSVETWPRNEVPYRIATSDFTADQVTTISKAVSDLNSIIAPCPQFIPYVPGVHQNWITIFSGTGCWAQGVGMTGGEMLVSLDRAGCVRPDIVMHESGHVMGLPHEHCRPDRDTYITINWDAIQSGWEPQFNKVDGPIYGSYDFYSIMHYALNSASANGSNTMTPKFNVANPERIGQAPTFTSEDVHHVKLRNSCRK